MSRASTIRTLTAKHEFLATAEKGGDILAFLADDVQWWVPEHCAVAGTYHRDELVPMFSKVFAVLKAPPRFTIHHMTAEEDRVAVDCSSATERTDGKPFVNTYHFLFIIRDGRIRLIKEFLNTAYLNRFFEETGLIARSGNPA